jgi:hypothetical protein
MVALLSRRGFGTRSPLCTAGPWNWLTTFSNRSGIDARRGGYSGTSHGFPSQLKTAAIDAVSSVLIYGPDKPESLQLAADTQHWPSSAPC